MFLLIRIFIYALVFVYLTIDSGFLIIDTATSNIDKLVEKIVDKLVDKIVY
jgi:hypothetical protein